MPVHICAMLAQRSPQLFEDMEWLFFQPVASVPALILAVHAFLPYLCRRNALDVIYKELIVRPSIIRETGRSSSSPPLDVLEIIATFSEQPASFFIGECPSWASRGGKAEAAILRGIQLRNLGKCDCGGAPSRSWSFRAETAAAGRIALPWWVWSRVCVTMYGLPEAWFSKTFWTSASRPWQGQILPLLNCFERAFDQWDDPDFEE